MGATKPTDAQVAAAFAAALAYAERVAGEGAHWETLDAARDGATNGIMWALRNWNAAKAGDGGFEAFASKGFRRFVGRALAHLARSLHSRPNVVSLSGLEDAGREVEIVAKAVASGAIPLPEAVQELPEELRSAVRLFYVDRLTLRECGLLLGCAPDTVQERLKRAAVALAPDQPRPVRPAGEKRMLR